MDADSNRKCGFLQPSPVSPHDSKTAVQPLPAAAVTSATSPHQPTFALASSMTSTETLPTELLAQIFVEALGSPGHDVNPTLRRLLLVCRRWRDIAYGTPALWQHIYLKLDLVRDQASEARCRAYIDTFVCRANKIALYVVASGYNAYQASIWLAVRRVVGSICWSLVISIDEWSSFTYAAEVAACLDQVAPLLEILELRHDLFVGTHWTLPQARNLRKLVWNTSNTVFRWPVGIATFPLLRNIRVSIRALDITMQVAHIFSRCPKLDTLHFDVDLRPIPPIRAESASLRGLSLPRGLEPQFYSIRLPALQRADINEIRGARGDPSALFSGPLATIRTLIVGSLVMQDGAFARSLVHCSNLRVLSLQTLERFQNLEEVLEIMSQPLAGTQSWICPRLQYLHISDPKLEPENSLSRALLAFARNRTAGLSPNSAAFAAPCQRLERLSILPPLAYVGPSRLDYGWMEKELQALGLSTVLDSEVALRVSSS